MKLLSLMLSGTFILAVFYAARGNLLAQHATPTILFLTLLANIRIGWKDFRPEQRWFIVSSEPVPDEKPEDGKATGAIVAYADEGRKFGMRPRGFLIGNLFKIEYEWGEDVSWDETRTALNKVAVHKFADKDDALTKVREALSQDGKVMHFEGDEKVIKKWKDRIAARANPNTSKPWFTLEVIGETKKGNRPYHMQILYTADRKATMRAGYDYPESEAAELTPKVIAAMNRKITERTPLVRWGIRQFTTPEELLEYAERVISKDGKLHPAKKTDRPIERRSDLERR